MRIIFLLILITNVSLAQSGFKSALNSENDLPNNAFHVLEHDDNYYMIGQYFDPEILIWNNFSSQFNHHGKFGDLSFLRGDTISGLRINGHGYYDGQSYKYLTAGGFTIRMVNVDLEDHAVKVYQKIDLEKIPVSGASFLIDPESDMTYFVGRHLFLEPQTSMIAGVSTTDTLIYQTPNSEAREDFRNIRQNSEGNIVCLTLIVKDNQAAITTTHFDRDLNHQNLDVDTLWNFSYREGMIIDSEDSILAAVAILNYSTGIHKQGIVKFDKNGKLLWVKELGENINNYWARGRWTALVESHEKDGYIVAGAESQDTQNQDTLFSVPTIAKLSYEGELLWKKQYNFRSWHPKLLEIFYDIEKTKDGGYVMAGYSQFFEESSEDIPWTHSIMAKINSEGDIDTTTSVSVMELDKELSVVLYPNPSSDLVYLKQNGNERMSIEILDLNGRVRDRFISLGSNHGTLLNASDYPPGMYVVVARTDSGQSYTQKMKIVR